MPHHTYQHRAYTSRAGYARIAEVLRHNCDLYNAARLERMTAWKQARKSRTFYDQCKELTDIRQTTLTVTVPKRSPMVVAHSSV